MDGRNEIVALAAAHLVIAALSLRYRMQTGRPPMGRRRKSPISLSCLLLMIGGNSDKSAALLAQLDKIEAEMRRIGYWNDDPPDLEAQVAAGRIRTFLDAPSFELWLQCIFLPHARTAVRNESLPKQSQVGVAAMRQYDYHSHVPDAQILLGLLHDFDALVEGRPVEHR
jgi:uncharacterized protein YqcC (DUF446 family)